MPRPKMIADIEILEQALDLMRRDGPDALTFASLAKTSGLSGATLVQRFGSKPALTKAALLHAWDLLDAHTEDAIQAAPRTVDGVVQILLSLSQNYGGIESYADGLLLLREDLRDPTLRDRGKVWGEVLSKAIEERLPHAAPGIGSMVLAQWQGALLWWSFDPRENVERYVEARLLVILALVTGPLL